MSFDKPADHYDRFMGRFSAPLAPRLADAAGVSPGMQALDVGCGPGALTTVLAARLGTESVAGIDPSDRFVAACRERLPGADVRVGAAEELPWSDHVFDATLSCLVLGFMKDPGRGVSEMRRVTRPGGVVAVCFWDPPRHQMLELAADAIRAVRPDTQPRPALFGAREGDIPRALQEAGLTVTAEGTLTVEADYTDFDDLWEPLTTGVGPLGDVLMTLSEEERSRVQDHVRASVPDGPFSLSATAWYAVARA